MYIKRQLQKRLIISVISVMVLVITIMSSSYALFMDVNSNVNDQVLSVGALQITYLNESSSIGLEDLTPTTDAVAMTQNNNVYTFTIDNTGDLAYSFQIRLQNNPEYLPGGNKAINNILSHEYIRYSFNNEPAKKLSDTDDGLIFEGTLNPHTAKLYTVRIWVGSGNQTDPVLGLPNNVLGAEVHLNINIDGKASGVFPPGTLADVLYNANGGGKITSLPLEAFNDVADTPAKSGMFKADDDYGISYYFRGVVNNNNVLFGGYQWKIIRIDGKGNIKLIYNGTEAQFNTNKTVNTTGTNTQLANTKFNELVNDNKYVGYIVDGQPSTVKSKVDEFYIGLSTEAKGKIVDSTYCNDKTFVSGTGIGTSNTNYGAFDRLQTKKTPTLICPESSGKLILQIGLISADEVAYAGGKSWTYNNTYYLYNSSYYWLISPYYFAGEGAGAWIMSSGGGFESRYINVNSGVRPVITINNSNIKLNSGDGTASKPYVIE